MCCGSCFVEDMLVVYDAGGETYTDSAGVSWNIVPVLSFVATDMKEARALKGMFESAKQRMPCNLCKVLYDDCGEVVEDPGDLEYRTQAESHELIKRAIKAER